MTFFSRREVDVLVDWIGENKQRVPPQKFQVSNKKPEISEEKNACKLMFLFQTFIFICLMKFGFWSSKS